MADFEDTHAQLARLREQVEPLLTPLPDVRQWRPAPAKAP